MTWLADFHERTDLNKYPIALRTRGGIGYKTPDGIVSNFVGNPVHYYDNGWKPITLEHNNGRFEGSEFGWNGDSVTYKKAPLFKTSSITFNGVIHPLNFVRDGTRLVADITGIGTYEILFTERGVKEVLTIPEPIDGLLTFQSVHRNKPSELYKHDRRIISETRTPMKGEEYLLTSDMKYPVVIDPDYSADSGDGRIQGSSTSRATARSTATAFGTTETTTSVYARRYVDPDPTVFYMYIRYFVKFDTSGIPDGDNVSSVIMKLTPTALASNTDIYIKSQNWSAQDPIASGNMDAAYDNCLASSNEGLWAAVSSLTVNAQYSSATLDNSRIDKTGFSYYSLITKYDIDDTNLTVASTYGCTIANQENATAAYRPVLTVTHTAGSLGNMFMFF